MIEAIKIPRNPDFLLKFQAASQGRLKIVRLEKKRKAGGIEKTITTAD